MSDAAQRSPRRATTGVRIPAQCATSSRGALLTQASPGHSALWNNSDLAAEGGRERSRRRRGTQAFFRVPTACALQVGEQGREGSGVVSRARARAAAACMPGPACGTAAAAAASFSRARMRAAVSQPCAAAIPCGSQLQQGTHEGSGVPAVRCCHPSRLLCRARTCSSAAVFGMG
eukprot:365603-Chlamydomonas_euryale.AAC.3